MRILFVIHSIDRSTGGPAGTLWDAVPVLLAAGHEVEVCCLDASLVLQNGESFPSRVHFFGPVSGKYGISIRLLQWLRDNAGNFDHVIVRGIWQWHGLATYVATRPRIRRSKPVEYSVFPHGMLDPWFKKEYPLKHLKKQLYWLLAEYWILRSAKFVFFTAEQERLSARKSFFPYDVREQVIRYGIGGMPESSDRGLEKYTATLAAEVANPFLLFLGRIHRKKGLTLAITALAQADDQELTLVIAGPEQDPEYAAELRALSEKLGISGRVRFVGMIDGERKWAFLAAAEALLLPSYQENFGVVVAEALSCATPVLLSTSVDIWEQVVYSKAGLAAPATIEGVSSLLQRWHSLSADNKRLMGEAGKRLFASSYSITSAVDDLVERLSN